MNKVISSSLTFTYKFLFPSLFLSVFGGRTIMMFVSDNSEKWMSLPPLIFVVILVVPLYWLKKVELDGEKLVISNYFKSVAVSTTEIQSVRENRWVNIRPVFVFFRNKTDFGERIVFMPRTIWNPFRAHPVLLELKGLILEEE